MINFAVGIRVKKTSKNSSSVKGKEEEFSRKKASNQNRVEGI